MTVPATPTLTSITPSSGSAGTTVNATLTGTNFVTGATTVTIAGTGVTANSVTVQSTTSLTAAFAIAPGTVLGPYPVTVSTASGTSASLPFTVLSAPQIALDKNSLVFTTPSVGSSPPSQTLNISNAGAGTLTWTATPSSTGNWLTVGQGSGTGTTGITVSVAAGSLAAGTYTGSIAFSATGALNSPAVVPVVFRVAQADATGYVISTVAGADVIVEGGTATAEPLSQIWDVARDGQGNLYLAVPTANKIFKVTPAGTLSTFAGTGTPGSGGDGGPAILAQLSEPRSVVVDGSGNIYIADLANYRVRKVSLDGTITTFAGTGTSGFSGDGGPATQAKLGFPDGLGIDAAGNLYINDEFNYRIRLVTTAGQISTVAGNGTAGFSGDNGPATSAQIQGFAQKLAIDPAGNLYIPDSNNARIRKVAANGTITTIAGTGVQGFSGDGGAATAAELSSPDGIVMDASGNLFIADSGNARIRKIGIDGTISTVAGNGNFGFNGDSSTATSAWLDQPDGLAVDQAGNVYIADFVENRVRELSTSGSITTLAGNYVVFSGDNGPATSATLRAPNSVAVDNSGNLFIADSANFRVREVAANGTITTIAGTGSSASSGDNGPATSAAIAEPTDVAVDGNGNIYIATSAYRVRKISTNGTISTVAGTGVFGYSGDGGPATSAQLGFSQRIAVDVNGNIYIADTNNNRVRKISSSGIITTIAGVGTAGFSGDGGPATAAQLNSPGRLALDPIGNLYIADANNKIRKVGLDGTISTFSTLGGYAVSTDESGNVLVSNETQIFRLPPSGGRARRLPVQDWQQEQAQLERAIRATAAPH